MKPFVQIRTLGIQRAAIATVDMFASRRVSVGPSLWEEKDFIAIKTLSGDEHLIRHGTREARAFIAWFAEQAERLDLREEEAAAVYGIRTCTYYELDTFELTALIDEYLGVADFDSTEHEHWMRGSFYVCPVEPEIFTDDARETVLTFTSSKGRTKCPVTYLLCKLASSDRIPWGSYLIQVRKEEER